MGPRHPGGTTTEPALVPFPDPFQVHSRPPMVRAAVRASVFLALSKQDFLGGGGGISSVSWWAGPLCQASFAAPNLSEIRSFK